MAGDAGPSPGSDEEDDMADDREALLLLEDALRILDRLGLALPAVYVSQSIATLEDSVKRDAHASLH
ncbi:hypothetical protein BW41_01957 [Sphingomonas sp. RIT328]|nr:hypothetical protein BW41_01957 [Sphingomonas sp. RIT328]